MSACQRKISRLPISVFQDLITRPPLKERDDDPESIKSSICKRLKRFRIRNRNEGRNSHSSSSSSSNNNNNNNNAKHKLRRGGMGTSLPTTRASSIETIGQLLRLSKYTLLLALDPVLTYEEVEIFVQRVCNQCAPRPTSVLQLLRAPNESTDDTNNTANFDQHGMDSSVSRSLGNQKLQLQLLLPTSLPSLDRILHGGVRLATITELVGRSGVGKTQLALQLCITAAKFNRGAIYIDTEKKLSLERLREMSEHRRLHALHEHERTRDRNEHGNDNPRNDDTNEDAVGTFKPGEIVLDNLTVHQPGTSEELLDALDELEYEILIRNQRNVRGKYPVRLLVVDSIAAPIRRDFGMGSAPQRAAIIFRLAQKLKRLADQLHLAVVVINQVGSGGEDTGGGSNGPPGSASSAVPVRAALGTSWHHCVSTRLSLETSKQTVYEDNGNHSTFGFRQAAPQEQQQPNASRVIRKIAISKSNKTGFGETSFDITTRGIVEVQCA
jgi:RecA/RadA recombinase